MTVEPDYGNWVSKRLIYTPAIVGIIFCGLGLLLSLLLIPAVLFLFVSAYFAYARALLGGRRNVQGGIVESVLSYLDWSGEGRALDIGCGSASLTIKLAQKYPKAQVVGVDYWSGNWEYSKEMCETNAKIEQVTDRVTFQKASASALPFSDGYFDAVVSNLVFHEVRDSADKREVVHEALRVLKKGGKFSFQDLFLLRRVYGDVDNLLRTIQSWGIAKVEFVETRKATSIPLTLKLPFMLGRIGIITGEK
jgi:SAM-dependent methyltransferase